MSLTLPSIVPVGYAADYSDFLRCKSDRSGAMRVITGFVSVPTGTASGALVGLFPFRAGMKVHGLRAYCDPMDTGTSLLLDIGYQYYDSATGTSNPAAYISASTAAQSGGANVTFTGLSTKGGMTFDPVGDGWVVARPGAISLTLAPGGITFNMAIAYDPSGVTN